MKSVHELYKKSNNPVKIIQFGEGNFLRAFVDYGVDVANEQYGFNGNVAIIIPIKGEPTRKMFEAQDSIYTVCLRGKKDNEVYKENRVITCIDSIQSAYDDYDKVMALAHLDTLEFVVSNTTEAGIVFDTNDKFELCPPVTFPGKLTKFLYERYQYFKGDANKGVIMLPVELIDDNGETLHDCVLKLIKLWNLEDGFLQWIEKSCKFASTLVDRIVTGYPKDGIEAYWEELGYHDNLVDIAEPFGLWVIGDASVQSKLPLNSNKLQVEFTDKLKIYKERKVRILNGAHTSMVLGAYLSGLDYVGQCMADSSIRKQLDQSVFEEIVPTVHMPIEKAKEFANAVFERFENPFVKHALLSISLNSISKWKARVLPTFKDYMQNEGKLPKWLTYSLAALLAFYRSSETSDACLIGHRGNDCYEIHDDADKLAFIASIAEKSTAEYVRAVLGKVDFWGEDLNSIEGLTETVTEHLDKIAEIGFKAYIEVLGNSQSK